MVHPARGIPPVRLLAPPWVCHPPARVHVRLLGPCFKTGRMESPERQRLERAGAKARQKARASFLGRHDGIGGATKAPSCPAPPAPPDHRPAPRGGPAPPAPH